MGILATQEPGVLFTAVFEQGSKTLKQDIAAFEAKLTALQKTVAAGGFVVGSKREGKKLTVKVLASSEKPPAGAAAQPKAKAGGGGWAPKGQSAREVASEVKKEISGWGKK